MEPSFSQGDRRDTRLEAIFRTHFADLYRYIYRQVHHAASAEDLTSIVFLKALRWLQQDRSQESVKGWLYATARSTIADYWHQQAQMDLLPLEAVEDTKCLRRHAGDMSARPVPSDENNEQLKEIQARIQHLLDLLPSRERDILTLRYLQGYSAAEIGQILGLNAKHVRVLQLRALRRIALLEAEERNVSVESPNTPYNQQASRVLELAREEAQSFNHNFIGTEHLLLGILREGSAAAELTTLGVTVERMRGGIMFIIGRPQSTPASPPDFTARTQKVLTLADEEAQRVGEPAISPHHLLVAILREGQGIAAHLLQASGVHWEEVGATIRISKPPEPDEGPIILPTDLQEALQQHPAAQSVFEKLSYTKKKQFVDWIEQAEGETAKSQQIEKTIQQLNQIYQFYQQRQQ